MRSLLTGEPGGYTREERRNLDIIRELRRAPVDARKRFMAPGYKVHRRGMAHLAERGGGYTRESIADRADDIEDMIAKGDRVWAIWTIRGTHTGLLYGVEATGRPIEILEVGVWRLADGLVEEAWFFADELALVSALGVAGA
ncbi:ester cyclase [Actinomadura sp. 1N219]|uniref:ester cyclase n=1 Tax=Actinomadura sp. 1N219 TaxID=3375152 RepID=UPI0037B85AED